MSSKKLDRLMDQRITPWDRALYTRLHLFNLLKLADWSRAAIDYWVFSPKALSDEEIHRMYASGDLINTIPNVFPDWYIEIEEKSHMAEPETLWTWAEQSETSTPVQIQPSREEKAILEEQKIPATEPPEDLKWEVVLQELWEAVSCALRSGGFLFLDEWEKLSGLEPQEKVRMHQMREITWRVRALADQLKPQGPICFARLCPFPSAPFLCGLCGGKLSPPMRYECVSCVLATQLALGFVSCYSWLSQQE